jgi:nitrite reductase/ring-hydroxylating ferredoxin subunit
MAARQRLICTSAELAEAATGVRFTVNVAGETAPAFAIRFGGQARAYLNRCGHVSVELDMQPGEFFESTRLYLICATHGALYDPASGACLGGPCNGRGLQPLVVAEREGGIYLEETDADV